MASHLPGNFARGGPRTLCDLPITPHTELADEGDATCDECVQIDQADAASLAALSTTEHIPDPLASSEPFSSTAGYRPKGAR